MDKLHEGKKRRREHQIGNEGKERVRDGRKELKGNEEIMGSEEGRNTMGNENMTVEEREANICKQINPERKHKREKQMRME